MLRKLVHNGEKTDNEVLVIAGVVYLVVVLLILIFYETIKQEIKVRCMSDDFTYLTKGKIYTVTDIDNSNNNIDILMMRGDIDTYSFLVF